ncbi:hypothetical protein VXJ37_15825, partial [Arthrobacter nitrophenolicus]
NTGGGGTTTGGGDTGGNTGTGLVTVVPNATAPAQTPTSASKAAVPAPVAVGTNQGYNAQTAVGAPDGLPGWLAGLGALAAAGTAVAVRRQSRPVHTSN